VKPRGVEVGGVKPTTESAIHLEQSLCFSFEPRRQRVAGHGHYVGARERLQQLIEPLR
jgi:hypothetical protein